VITIRTGLIRNKQELLWQNYKQIKWLFSVTMAGDTSPRFYWSTVDTSYDGQDYDYKIMDFNGISMEMPDCPITLTTSFLNSNVNGYLASEFLNAKIKIRLIVESDLRPRSGIGNEDTNESGDT